MRSPSARYTPFWLGCFLMTIYMGTAWAAPQGEITGAEVDAKENRILIPYKGTVGAHHARVIGTPNRLVIDFDDTRMEGSVPPKIAGGGEPIHEIRLGHFKERARVVVDFGNGAVPPYRISQEKSRVEVRFRSKSSEQQEVSGVSSNAGKPQSGSPLSPEVVPAAANSSPAEVKTPPTRLGSGSKGNHPRLAQARVQTSGSFQGKVDQKDEGSTKPGSGPERKTSRAKSGKVAQTMELQRPETPAPMRREPTSPPAPPAPEGVPSIPARPDSRPMPVGGSGPRMVREVRPPVTPPTPDPRLVVQEIAELKFIQVGHNSRLVIKGGDHLDYRVNKISPTKVRLDLVNAEIPKVHQKPLRTDLFSTSVEMIVPGSQTIFVQLKDAVPYQVQKQKGVLMVDFPPPRFAMTEDQKAVLKGETGEKTGDRAGREDRDRVRERLLEKRGAARAMQEEEARRKIDTVEGEIALLDKVHEELLKERREVARQYRVTPDPEVFRKPVTMDFQGISLKNAFRLLGEQAGINIIVGDDVKGNATLRLLQVPLGQVIDDLLRINNLDRDLIGNVMWVGDKKKIDDSKKQRRDEQERFRRDVENRIKQNRDGKKDLERQREKAVEKVAKAEAAVEEAPEEAPGIETVGATETIEIEGEPVTLLLVQIRLNYAKPTEVKTVLDCVFNRKCAGIAPTPEQQREEARATESESLQAQGFMPGSIGYEDRMRSMRQDQATDRRLQILERGPRGERERVASLVAGYVPSVDMDTKFKKLLAHTMIWGTDSGGAAAGDKDGGAGTKNLLFIRDTPERIEEMKKLIVTLDIPIPQVLIEARIVQVDRDWARGLGIMWGGANNQSYVVRSDRQAIWGFAGQQGATANTPTGGAPPATPIGTALPSSLAVNFPVSVAKLDVIQGLGMTFGLVAGQYATDLDLRLQLGESTGKLKIISRPKVQVVDGKDANIKQGRQIAYTTTSAQLGTQTQLVSVDLLLKVKPRIYPDSRIIMDITVTDNDVGDIVNGQASINTREAKTNMIVKDGETAVIGGIVKKRDFTRRQGWPGLMNVPLINLLFSNKQSENSVVELLVFITPTIVKRPPPAA